VGSLALAELLNFLTSLMHTSALTGHMPYFSKARRMMIDLRCCFWF
jgi:hypothetical protein